MIYQLMDELRSRYKTPRSVCLALGLDEALLADNPRSEKENQVANDYEDENDGENEQISAEQLAALLRAVDPETLNEAIQLIASERDESDEEPEEVDDGVATDTPRWGKHAMDEASYESFFERFPGAERVQTGEIAYGTRTRDLRGGVAFDGSSAQEEKFHERFPSIRRAGLR